MAGVDMPVTTLLDKMYTPIELLFILLVALVMLVATWLYTYSEVAGLINMLQVVFTQQGVFGAVLIILLQL